MILADIMKVMVNDLGIWQGWRGSHQNKLLVPSDGSCPVQSLITNHSLVFPDKIELEVD